MTKGMVTRAVHRFLDKKFNRKHNLLSEVFLPANDLVQEKDSYDRVDEHYEYEDDELVQSRWMRIAGLGESDNE